MTSGISSKMLIQKYYRKFSIRKIHATTVKKEITEAKKELFNRREWIKLKWWIKNQENNSQMKMNFQRIYKERLRWKSLFYKKSKML